MTQSQIQRLKRWESLAGFADLQPRKRGWTKDETIAELKRVAKQLGYTPAQDEFIKHASVGISPVLRLFGSWNRALELAGLGLRKEYHISKERIIVALTCVASKLGNTPTMVEFNQCAAMSANAVRNVFGSWTAALEYASLTLNHEKNIPKDRVIAELKRVAKELAHAPSVSEFNKLASISAGTVVNVFSSWSRGLKAAGLKRAQPEKRHIHEAKILIKTRGKLPTGSWLRAHGYSALDGYRYAHPEKFKHLENMISR